MSKLVTQRFEYVNYDDSTQAIGSSGVITAYPVATDQYSNNATSSAGTSYGSANVTTPTGGASAAVNVPVGATVTMIGAASNGVYVSAVVNNVQLVPGGATISAMTFPVAPGQIVTLPGQFNNGTLNVQSQSSTLGSAGNVGSLQLLWSV
jgi:hypothetical protein